MTRSAIKRWVGACLLGSALATGCSHYWGEVDDPPAHMARPVTRPTTDRPIVAQRRVEEPRPQAPKNEPTPEIVPSTAAEGPDSVKAPSITQTAFDSSKLSPAGEPGSMRKSFVDITAHPYFSHTDDYRCLHGQLQHSRITKSWRLRYASVDEADPYGGSVTLTDESRLSGFRDGDFIRVHGRFVSSEERGIAPAYLIDTIQPIDKRE
jgi:hypothetical protein